MLFIMGKVLYQKDNKMNKKQFIYFKGWGFSIFATFTLLMLLSPTTISYENNSNQIFYNFVNKEKSKVLAHTMLIDDDHVDQFQISWDAAIAAAYPDMLAQSFIPTENKLTKVQILMHKIENPTANISVSIRKTKDGIDLTSKQLSPDMVPDSRSWIEFDFPNVSVIPYETYYIIWKPLEDNMFYFWWGSDNSNFDSYPNGEAWLYSNNEWDTSGFVIKDWCFKTFGYHASRAPVVPMQPIGPVEGLSWHELSYETMATDPDLDKIRYGWDWDDDNIVDEWTEYYPSGEIITNSHSFECAGFFNIKVKAEDKYGIQSVFSLPLCVNVSNDPPEIPVIVSGPDYTFCYEENIISVVSNDPEGEDIRYGWDWDGDEMVDEWTEYYPSGETINCTHVFSFAGTYYIGIIAEDSLGAQSRFSDKLRVIVINVDNEPPNKPSIPEGATMGRIGVSYSYNSVADDPNGDRIYYQFDWDDGTKSDWLGPYVSGQGISTSHIWSNRGSFQVKVKAKDESGEESVWSDPLSISMPKQYRYQLLLHQWLLMHPFFRG
jgi:PKD domain-containing protein